MQQPVVLVFAPVPGGAAPSPPCPNFLLSVSSVLRCCPAEPSGGAEAGELARVITMHLFQKFLNISHMTPNASQANVS